LLGIRQWTALSPLAVSASVRLVVPDFGNPITINLMELPPK